MLERRSIRRQINSIGNNNDATDGYPKFCQLSPLNVGGYVNCRGARDVGPFEAADPERFRNPTLAADKVGDKHAARG